MHKHTRLLPYMRRELCKAWVAGTTVTRLSREYRVSRVTVYKVLRRARLQEFSNRRSVNRRFRTLEYGLRRLSRTEGRLQKRLDRLAIRRYEKASPGEMVHFDTKRLPLLQGEAILDRREHLHVAVDDYSRYLVADVLPDKSQYSGAIHLEEVLRAAPFTLECAYSDNGAAYRGRPDHAFVALCCTRQITQRFTKVKHPWTNGKAERVIRTIMTEWCRPNRFRTHEERRASLQRYVDSYNFRRPHTALKGLTPMQRIASYVASQKC
jgi:transposase InsO family protein